MPKTKRDILKRHLAFAYHNLDLAGYHLHEIVELFAPVHPELAKVLEAVQSGLIIQMKVLTQFAYTCWGIASPDWDSWRGSPDPLHESGRPIELDKE